MLKFIIKRILLGFFILVGLSLLIFFISRVVPGDPARMALGPTAPDFAVEELRKEMHLNEPLHIQYYYWFSGVFRGDFGKSVNTKRPVLVDIKDFLPATLELVLFSSVITAIMSIILGVLSAGFCDRWVDSLIRAFSYISISIPDFVVSVLLILIFGHIWQIIPVLGRLSPGVASPENVTGLLLIDSLFSGNFFVFIDASKHLLLPSIALSTSSLFQLSRILRSSLTDNLNKEYIMVFKGYGVPYGTILGKYLLKPSLAPYISVYGLTIAEFMGKAFIVETIFNWPGLSRYGMISMLTKDLNAISAAVLITGLAFMIANIFVDIALAIIDPRVKLGGSQ